MAEAWEMRTNTGQDFGLEIRMGPGGPMLVGYGVVYNSYSEDLGGFIEVALPGSGAKTIAEQDVRSLLNHNPDNLLGRKGAGTLRLSSDARGVRYEVDLLDTQTARDVRTHVAAGNLAGSSFTFQVIGRDGQSWTRNARGYPVRQLHEFRMRDIGPVVFPAYAQTEVALRSLAEQRSLSYDAVVEAARLRNLAALLDPEDQEVDPPAAAPPRIVRRRVYW